MPACEDHEYSYFAAAANYVLKKQKEDREELAEYAKCIGAAAAMGALAYNAFQNRKRAAQVGGSTKVQMR